MCVLFICMYICIKSFDNNATFVVVWTVNTSTSGLFKASPWCLVDQFSDTKS